MNFVVINPAATGRIFDGSLATSNPVEVLIISSPAKSFEFGLIKLLMAEACLASTETIFPANNK
ncbi:hypothetical protein D3C86_1674630 [compost metagenome]